MTICATTPSTVADAATRPVESAAVGEAEVRFFAAAKERAGAAGARWAVLAGDTIGDLLVRHGLAEDPVFRRSSFLLNAGQAAPSDAIRPGDALDVLPPFAGG